MSKMPAKKKSCFQITSVTQAQVAASSITDDTESLDDPDESRTEDVSSEIFDVCRPDLTVCERSSSEETLNNVGETPESQQPTPAPTLENSTDSGYSVAHPAHTHVSEPLQQGYSLAPQLGSGASAFHPTGYSNTASQQAQINMQPVAAQNFLSNSLNGVHHGAMHQVTPIMPPATQAQQFAYSTHPTSLSTGQLDYSQQHFVSSTQNLPMSVLPVGPPTSQVPSSLITHAGQGARGLGGEASSIQSLLLQVGNASAMAAILTGTGQQQHVSRTQPSGGLGTPPAPSIISQSCIQNAPATVPNSNNTVQSQASSTGGLVMPHGANGGATTGLPFIFRNRMEDIRRKSDAHPHSAIVMTGKDGITPFLGQGLNLPSPAVNSLFGIHITMDVDEDRGKTNSAFHKGLDSFSCSVASGSSTKWSARNVHVSREDRLVGFHYSRAHKPSKESENMRCKMSYSLPCSPGASPAGRLVSYRARCASASGASVVAIDNKIEQAMDLVKSHLMYAVREEVEVLKEQIKELYERNSMLERENAVLKSLANTDQLGQVSSQLTQGSSTPPQQQHPLVTNDNNNTPLAHHEGSPSIPHQPNITSA
ncbi:TSC22 domain family protein 2 [Liparis tanakae]|uniref:TSC22 domain family protein 2 n=1 Tax=Liparis tanakae TaxID=230148 RepID=A0A4Z2J3S7_9TELE|nr:TSC22 domain family protein 2 [Liparis tanakae]